MTDNLIYSKGICWIDDCRIPFVDDNDKDKTLNSVWHIDEHSKQSNMGFGTKKIGNVSKDTGRFPANILVSDDVLNDGSYGQNNTKNKKWELYDDFKVNEYLVGLKKTGISRIADKGTNSRYYDIDKWFEKLIEDVE